MLKAIVDKETFDGLGDMQEHYSEKEGSYFLSVIAVNGIELANTGNLKKALQKEREAAKTATDKFKAFEGIDPEEARDALSKMSEMDDWDPDKKLAEHKVKFEKQMAAQFANDRTKLVEKHTAEMVGVKTKHDQLTGQLRETMIKSAANQAITKAGGSHVLLLPLVESSTRMRQLDDGKFIAEVLDTDGSVRLSSSAGSTDPMTIEEYVMSLREDEKFSGAFDSSGTSGAGSTGNEGTSKGGVFSLSSEDARDPAKYRTAKEAAEKAGEVLQLGT